MRDFAIAVETLARCAFVRCAMTIVGGKSAMRYERNFEINEAYTAEPGIAPNPSWLDAFLWSLALFLGILFCQGAVSLIAWLIFAR